MMHSAWDFIRKSIAIIAALAAIVLSALQPASAAPVVYTSGTYSQDFQSMSTTTGSSSITLTQMAEVSSLAGGGTVNGWYVYDQAGWATGYRWFSGAAGNGSSSTGAFYGMYSSTGGNLALGSQGSGNSVAYYGVILQNNSGSTINSVSLSWDAVINRNPSTTANPTFLSWLVSGSSALTASTGTAAGTFNDSAGSWTTPGGVFSYSTPGSGTGAPGTQAAINPMYTFASPSGNLSSLNWANGNYLYLRWKETDDSGSDATFGIDNFKLWTAAVAAANLTWNTTSGTWNTSTTNWLNSGSSASAYTQGDNVAFSGTGGGTITLSGSLAPASFTISANAGTYTFSGASASDKISGATSIAKSGAGAAVFTSANDFSGGTTITGGIVSISGSDQLGAGTITVNGGQLTSTAGSALTLANALTVGGSNGTVATGDQNLTINGGATIGGALTKTGNGTLVLASPTLSTGAAFTVSAGAVQIGGPTTSGVYSIATANALTGNLTIGGTQRLNVNTGGSITGAGTLGFLSSGALLSNLSGTAGGTVSAPIALNSGNAAFTPGVYTTGSYTPASFTTTIGATKGAAGSAGTLTVNSVISGSADLNISNNSLTGGGGGLLVLGGQSTYSGNTLIDTNVPDATNSTAATIQLGVSNALPATTGVIVGTRSGVGAAIMDLNGFNQKVAFVGDGQFVTASKFLTITNLGSGTSTFTIDGSTNATFSGVFASGSAGGRLNLVKQGSGAQTLTGSSTYGGGTTLNAGSLVAGNVNAFGTGSIVVNGGTLDLASLAIANTITNNGGSIIGASGYAGTQNVSGAVAFSGTVGGTVNVGTGGTLSGNGVTFNGSVSIGDGGFHSPGASPGSQTFNGLLAYSGSSALNWELWGNTDSAGSAGSLYDSITVASSGSLSIGAGAVVNLLFGTSGGGSTVNWSDSFWSSDRTWTVINAASALSNTGTFTLGTVGTDAFGVSLVSARPDASFKVLRSAGGDVQLNFVAVPEPSSLALAGLGAAFAGYAAWKRRRAA